MNKKVLLKGGHVIDPANNIDGDQDVLISNGVVQAVGPGLDADGAEVIDVTGKVVAPGLIDIHVHFREPGFEESETVATGAMAAVAGGFTTVCPMPNTDPVTDNQAAVGFIVKQARDAGLARVLPIAAISLGQKGEKLTEFGEVIGAGAVAVSDDGKPVVSSHLMRTALEYAQTFDIPVVNHCEDPTLAEGGSMHEGLVSSRLGLKGIPSAAESIMVARDVLLAELTGGHIHLCHMSTKESIDIIRQAKARGVNVTAEVTPHHLVLQDAKCEGYDTNSKMNPPLRTDVDVQACVDALVDGTIDVVATDHAPHHYELKEREFENAPFGIVGLETALGLCISQLVDTKLLTLSDLISKMSHLPAKVFGIPGGDLAVGNPADVVVFDANEKWEVDPDSFRSKSKNTPFAGWELKGRVHRTMVAGRTVFELGVS